VSQKSIRLIGAIDCITERSVEVDVIFLGRRSETMKVEPAIAPNERIEGPGDCREIVVSSPRTLMLFESATETAMLESVDDTSDVRMQDEVTSETAEHAERTANHDSTPHSS
jgi:hypothetical protein